jgi:ERCC4-type nuclease
VKSPITILQDVQEKLPLARYFDPKLVRVETVSLATGDYTLKNGSHLLAIERKHLNDLLACVTSDRERWMDQMRRMKGYPTRFLVIEATREQIEAEVYSRNVRALSVVNSLLGVEVRWNVCVEYCDGPREAARMIQFICLKVAQLQKEGFYDEAQAV